MAVSDLFDFVFTDDDSITHTDATTQTGRFPLALTAFSFTRNPSNTGSWDPSVGTFFVPRQLGTNSDTTSIQFVADGSGFPALGGDPFSRLFISLPVLSVFDSGAGQTIAQQLGGVPAFNALGGAYGFIEAGFGEADFAVTAFHSSGAVPERAACWLISIGGGLLLAAT